MSSSNTETKLARKLQALTSCAYMVALNAVRCKVAALIADDELDRGEAYKRCRDAAERGDHKFFRLEVRA